MAGLIEGERKRKADMLIELLEDEFGSVDQGTRFLVYELMLRTLLRRSHSLCNKRKVPCHDDVW